MIMNVKPLTIGSIAKRAGVSVETIRYYQREGLIAEPLKPVSGFRVYPTETIDRIKFIQRSKRLGFTLAEIKNLLQLSVTDCSTTRALTQQKLDLIRSKIADLQSMEAALEQLVTMCESSQPTNNCPIIAALNDS
jgi:MerR family transcriptional regulator, mercuric resistance operon regulatory protein